MKLLKKIVIVEDDLFLQDFYKMFFKKIGGEIIILENADEILQVINSGNICLIIMDINLRNTFLHSQRVDGIKFSRFIKEKYPHLHIPIILITAYHISSYGKNLLEESLADDYLVKPITDYNKLIDKINKLVL
jgi:CheY-like chemotaxis protein